MIDISYALTVEGWKPISGFPGYEVSSLGYIRSFRRRNRWKVCSIGTHSKPVVLHENKWGYWHFGPRRDDGKRVNLQVHQVVAAAFIGECPDGYEVNHRDGVKGHNWVENLEYVTPSENAQHSFDTGLQAPLRGLNHPLARLTEENVLKIRAARARGGLLTAIAVNHGITFQTVSDICRRKSWSHM